MKKLLLLLAFGFISFGSFAQLCFAAAVNVTQVSCNGTNDGSIVLAVDQSCGPYHFYWSPNTGIPTMSPNAWALNLAPGNYSVTYTNVYGNGETFNITLTQKATPTITNISLTSNTCSYDANGAIAFTTNTTGTGIQGYVWSNGVSGTGAPGSLTGLINGTYTVTVTENSGCNVIQSFTINSTDPITSFVTIQDVSCIASCNGAATINASSPSGVSYLWSTGSTATTISNLCPSNYSVTITNGTGCTKVNNFAIVTNPQASISWHKNTVNQAGANDMVKRVIRDPQGNVYVMGEFIDATNIDGVVIQATSFNTQPQTGIFVAKYNTCGDLKWLVHTENPMGFMYGVDGFDLDFDQLTGKVVL